MGCLTLPQTLKKILYQWTFHSAEYKSITLHKTCLLGFASFFNVCSNWTVARLSSTRGLTIIHACHACYLFLRRLLGHQAKRANRAEQKFYQPFLTRTRHAPTRTKLTPLRNSKTTFEFWISRCYCFDDRSAAFSPTTQVRLNSEAVKSPGEKNCISDFDIVCPEVFRNRIFSAMSGYFFRAFFGPSLSRMYGGAGGGPHGREYLPTTAERYGSTIVTVVSFHFILVITFFNRQQHGTTEERQEHEKLAAVF